MVVSSDGDSCSSEGIAIWGNRLLVCEAHGRCAWAPHSLQPVRRHFFSAQLLRAMRSVATCSICNGCFEWSLGATWRRGKTRRRTKDEGDGEDEDNQDEEQEEEDDEEGGMAGLNTPCPSFPTADQEWGGGEPVFVVTPSQYPLVKVITPKNLKVILKGEAKYVSLLATPPIPAPIPTPFTPAHLPVPLVL